MAKKTPTEDFRAGSRFAQRKMRAELDAAYERGFQAGLVEGRRRMEARDYEGEVLEFSFEFDEYGEGY